MQPLRSVAVPLALVMVLACGGGDGGGTTPGATLTASPDTLDLADCATGQITAVLYDGDGNPVSGAAFTYASTATSVASVAGGVVTAQSPGVAEIEVRNGALRDTVVVNVTAAPLTLTFSADTISVYETTSKPAGVAYRNCHGQTPAGPPLVYSSTDSQVVTLTPTQLVNGLAPGTAVVTVSNGTLNDELSVTVRSLPGISGSPQVSGSPFGIAASLSKVYVTVLGSAVVADADVSAPVFNQAPIAVGAFPTDIAFNPAGTKAYVTNQGGNTLGVIDVATRTQVATIPVSMPFRVLLNASGSRAFVTTGVAKLYVINTATNAILDSLLLNGSSNGLALSGDNRLYATVNGSVVVVNASSYDLEDQLVIGGVLQDIAVSPDDNLLYIADENGQVRVWSVPGDSLVTSLPVPSAFGLKLSPDQNLIFVGGGTSISIIERSTVKALKTFPVGGLVRRIAFTPDGQKAFVANELGGFVTIIE
jgi:YVTN family beta-propeller protein